MKHFLLFIAIILVTGTIAQNTFFQEYPEEAYQVGTDIFALDNGNYVVAGYSKLFKAENYQFFKTIDSEGNEISTNYISSSAPDVGQRICSDYDNNLLILRDSTINDTSYLTITKSSVEGEIMDSHIIMPGNANGIVKDGDQGYYVFGTNDGKVRVIKLDNSFDVVWTNKFYPTQLQSQTFIPFQGKILNNNLYIVGNYRNSIGYFDDSKSFIIKISNTGDSLNCLNLEKYYYQCYNSLMATSDGNLVTAGVYGEMMIEDTASILKLTPELDEIWNNTFYYEYGMYCENIVETIEGDFIVCGGQFQSNFSSTDMFLKKIDPDGEDIWYNQMELGDESYGINLLITEDESILCTGFTSNSDNEYQDNAFLLKTDSEGNLSGINYLAESNFNIDISPNPAAEKCAVLIHDIHGSSVSISVYNNSGQKVIEHNISEVQEHLFSKTLELNNLNPGIYFIQISIDGIRETRKLVVN